ncbi:MAG: hypothetical protein ACNA71_01895 [Kiritimatiellia bacterium]
MENRRSFFLPAAIATMLLALLLLIGWLAFTFFDALAKKTTPVEPFFAVTTAGVERVTMRAPRSHEQIMLPQDKPDRPGRGDPSLENGDKEPLASMPAVCIHSGKAITGRQAWHNPVEHTSLFFPDRVLVTITTPLTPHEDSP